MIGNGAKTIGSLGAVLTSDQQEELFVQGKSFSFEDYFTFAADEVKTIVFDPTAFAGVQIVFNPLIFSATAGPIMIDFYTGSESNDDGTVLLASNRREGLAVPVSILRLNPTGIVLGTRFSGDLVPATGTAPATSSGGSNEQGLPFEIDKTIKKALVLTNDDGNDVVAQIKMTWFEI